MLDVFDDGKKVAHLMFDLFPRRGKYGHACHWSMAHGSYRAELGGYEAPTSVIIANYSKATKQNPTLLTFWDVEALYHEFGHACHALLTRAQYASQSGTSVRQDFVETPSQLFEMWLGDNEYLKSVSSHYKTRKHLSLDVIEKIQSMRNVQALDQNFRTFVLALFDLKVHLNPKGNILSIRDKILKDYGYFKISKTSLWPASFSHIFGGYDVGYYGYMWALVYSYDIFSRFKKEGLMNKKVGMEFKRKILEKGDSEDPIKLMTDFLGRKPNNKAFLEALK
jgi:Zn-dependent oligopeptidase